MISKLFVVALAATFLFPVASAPIASFHFEVLAFVVWGAVALVLPTVPAPPSPRRSFGLLLTLFLLPAVSIAANMAAGRYATWQQSVVGVFFCLAGGVMAWAGWALVQPNSQYRAGQRVHWMSVFGSALVIACVLNAVAGFVQYLRLPAPTWLITSIVDAGRIYGNLRQPNQFALFMVWGILAVIGSHARFWTPLFSMRAQISPPLCHALHASLLLVLTVAIAMSGSRTGAVLVWVVAIGAGILPGLPLRTRLLAGGLGLVHWVAWEVLIQLDRLGLLPFFSLNRGLGTTISVSDSRIHLWADVITLIKQHLVAGVGYGLLNFELNANNLFGLPDSNNAHNLLLQLAVEHGLVFTVLWSVTLMVVLAKILPLWSKPALRLPLLGLGAILFHSLLEYPLWYAHFLLPTALVLGALVSSSHRANASVGSDAKPVESKALATESVSGYTLAAFAMLAGPLWAAYDYSKVSPIYEMDQPTHLTDRIVNGHQSLMYTYLADYASFTGIPVSANTAAMHYSLGMRIRRFDYNEPVAFQIMLAAGFTGRWDEAVAIHRRLKRMDSALLAKRVTRLSPDAKIVYTTISERAATSKPS